MTRFTPSFWINKIFLYLLGVGSFFWFDRFVGDVEDVQLSYSVVPIVVGSRPSTTSYGSLRQTTVCTSG